MPTDQILSTFPPANAEGAFGDRLPQIVLKRRTLAVGAQPGRTGADVRHAVACARRRRRRRSSTLDGDAGRRLRHFRHDAARPGRQGRRTGLVSRRDGNRRRRRSFRARRTCRCSSTCARSTSTTPNSPTVTTTAGLPSSWRTGCRCSTRAHDKPVRYMACLVNVEGQLAALPPPEPPVDHFSFELAQDWTCPRHRQSERRPRSASDGRIQSR